MRRLFATTLYDGGTDLVVLRTLMRHSKIRTPQDKKNATPVLILRHDLAHNNDLSLLEAAGYDFVVDYYHNQPDITIRGCVALAILTNTR